MEIYSIAERLKQIETPYYYYDTDLLQRTIAAAKEAAAPSGACIHYAVKANANPTVLRYMALNGLGADCVTGWEIERCLQAGIPASKIFYAGVGKTDKEINLALDAQIGCFNVESTAELKVINELAAAKGTVAPVALRINPNIDAHTHKYITTGVEENKFGLPYERAVQLVKTMRRQRHVRFVGLHFHIGSQITDMTAFARLCRRINNLLKEFEAEQVPMPEIINVGGGLGVNYHNPMGVEIPNFTDYFNTFADMLRLRPGQSVHCELGRALVAQCGALVTKVLYNKTSGAKRFAIVDAGFTDLIRPALYGARHHIVNLEKKSKARLQYDVVGPICESSDVFAESATLCTTQRGDFLVILSAGAYGHVMASQYNCRPLIKEYCTEDLPQ